MYGELESMFVRILPGHIHSRRRYGLESIRDKLELLTAAVSNEQMATQSEIKIHNCIQVVRCLINCQFLYFCINFSIPQKEALITNCKLRLNVMHILLSLFD